MKQTPKQWATTIFIFAIAIAIVAGAATKPTTISGRIELDPSVANKVTTPTIVFVIARDEMRKGHPILAKRIDVRQFPVSFTLGPQDAMMAGAIPPRVLLEARVDRDGDAATREPGAPSASIGGVALGSSNVVLRLR